MKTLSKKQRTFLEIVDRVNHQVGDSNANPENAIAWYDKEISPYGYPTHQSILMAEGMSMFHFNREIVKNQVKDKEGNLLLGEGFNDLSPRNTVPNYYITDDLAYSLIETETPKDGLNIDLEVLPLIKVIFSKKFDKINTISIRTNPTNMQKTQFGGIDEEGIAVRVNYTVPVEVCEDTPDINIDFFIPFNGKGHCMLCDTRELFHEKLLEKNYFMVRVSSHTHKDPNYFVAKIQNNEFRFRWWEAKHETAVNCVNDFIENQMNNCYQFVVNLLCLMTQEPEIITVQSPPSKYTATKAVGFGSEKVNNVPNVHWLGEYFTTRVVDSTAASEDTERTRGKPKKSHWRRGHWHTVLQGPGRTQKQLKWFRPTFIRGHAS